MSTGIRLWVLALLMWRGFLWGQTHDSLPPHAWHFELPAAAVSAGPPSSIHNSSSSTMAERLVGLPGLHVTSLGEGVSQPMIRGLQGSRVVLRERGMPLQGGRWGSDHGPVLAWQSLLPQRVESAVGNGRQSLGGLNFDSQPWLPHHDTTTVELATRVRAGDGLASFEARCIRRKGNAQFSFEAASTHFADRNVPDSGFAYLNRTLPIFHGRITNTSGNISMATAALRWKRRHDWEAAISGGQIEQGLFPGFIGFPLEADIQGDGEPRLTELPHATADRGAFTLRSWRTSGARILLGAQFNDRSEFAPPHAHGWGPEPDSPLSFRLVERGGYAQIADESGPFTWGAEAEWLAAETSGWEFLLPDHQRLRLGANLSRQSGDWMLQARLEWAYHRAGGHEEPAYSATGEVIGTDVRAEALHRQFVGLNFQAERPMGKGDLLVHAISRLPDAYELSAQGIHHGTARFEKGNPDLQAEHVFEVEWLRNGAMGEVRVWSAASPDFIFLAPTAQFAPIAHAGQVMAFEQAPAFRTGVEWSFFANRPAGDWFFENRGAFLGAWRLDEGTGLPLTPPLEMTFVGGWSRGPLHFVSEIQSIAASWFLARNELRTPGTVLFHGGVELKGRSATVRLRIRNAMNTSYFRHINPYRVLDLAEAGRTLELSFTTQF